MKLLTKRIYDKLAKEDGARVLVDRLWPRGIKKEDARIDVWAKELAPSNALRKWFHADPEKRFREFEKRYARELKQKRDALPSLPKGRVTFVTAVKEIERSHIPTLMRFLEKR